MNAESVRHSQACTQIMRVLYSIQYQEQRRLNKGIEHVVDINVAAGRIDVCCHALMARFASHARKPCTITGDQADALRFGKFR